MSVVAISQTHGSLGDEIGCELARMLGYEFVDREIILRAANRFGEEVRDLEHVTEEKPSLWERFTERAWCYRTYIHAIIWETVARDNVILSGRGAPFVLAKVRHALRVRVTAPDELRTKRVAEEQGLTPDGADHLVRHRDHERAARIKFLYQVDWEDSRLYDVVINTVHLDVKGAARLVQEALDDERFQATPNSLREVNDRSLAAWAEAVLLGDPVTGRLHLSLACTGGHISISGMVEREEQRKAVEDIVGRLPGVTGVRTEIALVPQHLIPE